MAHKVAGFALSELDGSKRVAFEGSNAPRWTHSQMTRRGVIVSNGNGRINQDIAMPCHHAEVRTTAVTHGIPMDGIPAFHMSLQNNVHSEARHPDDSDRKRMPS